MEHGAFQRTKIEVRLLAESDALRYTPRGRPL
jgi:hypothetical protein